MEIYWLWSTLAFLLVYIILMARGPETWDRLLSLSLTSTKILLLIVLYASYTDDSSLLDAAIIFALLGFMGIVFIALYFRAHKKGGGK